MNHPGYSFSSNLDQSVFTFRSTGPKGIIIKVVAFQPTNIPSLFNMAFGDKDPRSNLIDDMAISNNGDMVLILSTLISITYEFTYNNPISMIYLTGSTKSRTRLYRICIAKHLSDLKRDFEIYGEVNGDWVEFEKDIDYQGFLVKRII